MTRIAFVIVAIWTAVALLVVGGLVAFVVIVVWWDRQPLYLEEGQVVEGDGRKQWQVLDFVITIPDGARLVGGGYAVPGCEARPGVDTGCGPGTWLTDAATGAVLYLSECGKEYGRRGPRGYSLDPEAHIRPAWGEWLGPTAFSAKRAIPVRAHALFDELTDSVRLVDDPGFPACKPSE